MTWRPPHKTAQQKRKPPLERKLNAAPLAPSMRVEPVVCGRPLCGHARLIHRDELECLNARCACTAYVEVAGG